MYRDITFRLFRGPATIDSARKNENTMETRTITSTAEVDPNETVPN